MWDRLLKPRGGKSISKKNLDETSFFEHLDEKEAIFYKELLEFAKEKGLINQLGLKEFFIKSC